MLPDRIAINRRFVLLFGRKPDWRNPKTFNDKLQWLKLYHRDPRLTQLVDKIAVRKYVEARVGPDLLNDLYGVWDNADAIDLSRLPDRFILKATHGSTWNILCQDKSKLDWDPIKLQLKEWLNSNYYFVCRERCYKHIRPRIVSERLLDDNSWDSPPDYRFFCFSGQPKIIQVDVTRCSSRQKKFYDLEWRQLPFTFGEKYPIYPGQIAPPENLEQLLLVARKLSEPFVFCRVDLYSVNGKAVFGELTFYPCGGFGKFVPESFNRVLGDYLQLPCRSRAARWRFLH
jgi:TupA-like ATPgrasp